MTKIASAAALLLLAACASLPNNPNILVLPGTGKSFDQFRADDLECRSYAYNQIGGKGAEQAAGYSAQSRYDNAFTQCMYAKGHKVPVAGRYSDSPRSTQAARTPPPPPPPGQPPAEAPPDYRPK